MKIISWNVNGVRAWFKKGCLLWVLEQNPDVFCLQEMKAQEEQLPPELRVIEGYTLYMEHSKLKKGYSGVGIYVKKEIIPESIDVSLSVFNPSTLKSVAKSTPPTPLLPSIDPFSPPEKKKDPTTATLTGGPQLDHEGRFIALHIKDSVLINCYFPNGGGDELRLLYKMNFYKSFLDYIEKMKKNGKKVIFCGDVNVAHTEIDIARPKENQNHVGFLPEERKWVDSVIEAGFVDVYREKNPEQKDAYTWWDLKSFARDRNIGWRIDYFFIDKELIKRVTGVTLFQEVYGSDHCPISLDIVL
jgi:exodeoxyribonuclease III